MSKLKEEKEEIIRDIEERYMGEGKCFSDRSHEILMGLTISELLGVQVVFNELLRAKEAKDKEENDRED